MQLYNTLSAEARAHLIDLAGKNRLTISFYQYAKIENPKLFRNELFAAWQKIDALGRIYIATEGINAQMSVPAENFETFRKFLNNYSFLKDIRINVAVEHDDHSFLKLTVKVRNKIVADGLNDATFDVTNIGVHLNAKEFNTILENPDTIVVDFRNHYESEVGHFKGAITPDVETFRESLPIIKEQLKDYKESKNLVMYCTGGIRCEKASAYFKHQGFKNVFQLEGGIINYANQIKEQGLESKFIGKNFVFDHRLGERITDDIIAQCHQCGAPCDTHTNCANDGCHLLFIQCESCATKMQDCCSDDCLETINLPLAEQINKRKGKQVGNKIFRKGKSEALSYKKAGVLNSETLAKATTEIKPTLRKKLATKKVYVAQGNHYYDKAKIALFTVENNTITLPCKVIITGPTTGLENFTITQMFVNGQANNTATIGDKISFATPFKIRASDKMFKIL
jgi:UPF0176 protein